MQNCQLQDYIFVLIVKLNARPQMDCTRSNAHSLATSIHSVHLKCYMLLRTKMCFSSGIPNGKQLKMLTLLVKDVDKIHFSQLEVPSSNSADIFSLKSLLIKYFIEEPYQLPNFRFRS